MIFVTLGTNEAPFPRLLHLVDRLDLRETLVVQHGHTEPRIRASEFVGFLSFEEMRETIRRARAVVTHAGVGTVMVSLAAGRRPIVIPRRKALREAVDDHQLELAQRFATAGLVRCVNDADALRSALAEDQDRLPMEGSANALAADLSRFLLQTTARRPAR